MPVDAPVLAVALSRDGIEYGTLDGSLVKIVVLLLAPPSEPHIQVLAGIGALLNNDVSRSRLQDLTNREEIHTFFSSQSV